MIYPQKHTSHFSLTSLNHSNRGMVGWCDFFIFLLASSTKLSRTGTRSCATMTIAKGRCNTTLICVRIGKAIFIVRHNPCHSLSLSLWRVTCQVYVREQFSIQVLFNCCILSWHVTFEKFFVVPKPPKFNRSQGHLPWRMLPQWQCRLWCIPCLDRRSRPMGGRYAIQLRVPKNRRLSLFSWHFQLLPFETRVSIRNLLWRTNVMILVDHHISTTSWNICFRTTCQVLPRSSKEGFEHSLEGSKNRHATSRNSQSWTGRSPLTWMGLLLELFAGRVLVMNSGKSVWEWDDLHFFQWN